MGITGIHAIPMMITCMLQGTLCDTGIPCTFYGENICSVYRSKFHTNSLGLTFEMLRMGISSNKLFNWKVRTLMKTANASSHPTNFK